MQCFKCGNTVNRIPFSSNDTENELTFHPSFNPVGKVLQVDN